MACGEMRVLGQRGALDDGTGVALVRRLMVRLRGDHGASARLFDAGVHGPELLRGAAVDDSELPELAASWGPELAAPTFPRPKPRSV